MLSWFFFKAIVVFSTRDNYIISSCTVFMGLTHFLSLNRRLIMRGYCLSDWRVLWDLGKSGVVELEKMGRVLFSGNRITYVLFDTNVFYQYPILKFKKKFKKVLIKVLNHDMIFLNVSN